MELNKKIMNFIVVSIYIITLFLGVSTFFGIEFIDTIRRYLIVLLPASICITILIYNIKNIKEIFRRKVPIILYGLTIIWFFMTFLFGIKTGMESFKGFIHFSVLLTLMITLFNVKFKQEEINKTKKAIFISFGIVMLYGIIQYIFQINLNTFNNDKYPGILGRINSTFYIATVLDKYIIMMFPIITYELLKDKNNIFLKIILILSMFGVTFTFSRSGQSVYLVMCFIFFVMTLLKKQYKNSILIVALVCIMILIPGAKYSVQSGFNYAYDKANIPKILRLDFLKILGSKLPASGLDSCVDEDCVGDVEGSIFFRNYYENVGKLFIKEYPVFGIGVGNTSYLYNNQNAKEYLKDNSKLSDEFGYMYPHSGYIQLTEETGYIGFALFIITLISLGIIKLIKKETKLDFYVVLLLLLALFMGNLTEGLFHSKQIIYMFIIIYSIYCNVYKDSKKNILIASNNLDFGGIERALISLLKNIDYKKCNVTLALENKKGVFLNDIPENVRLVEYKVKQNGNVIIRKAINMLRQIVWNIKNYHSFDSSICYATYSKPCSFVARSSSKNTILYVHSNYKYIYNEQALRKFFDERHINQFNSIVFVSNESKKDLIKYYPNINKKSYIINNLVDYKLISTNSKEDIDILKKKHTFVFVGRLEEHSKKITRIIRVANKIKDNKDVEFWIIGDGPDKRLYEKQIKDYKLSNIKLLGSKANPYPYMKKADYLLLTSDYEGFPVVYNEAIALNKPILSTINVTDDFISIPNRFGVIMKKDVDDIYKTINDVIKNKEKYNEIVDFERLNKERIKKIEELLEVE